MSPTAISNLFNNQYFILFAVLWEMVWKGLALWKCAKNGQKAFFFLILVFNTFGLLPICYLIYRKIIDNKARNNAKIVK